MTGRIRDYMLKDLVSTDQAHTWGLMIKVEQTNCTLNEKEFKLLQLVFRRNQPNLIL